MVCAQAQAACERTNLSSEASKTLTRSAASLSRRTGEGQSAKTPGEWRGQAWGWVGGARLTRLFRAEGMVWRLRHSEQGSGVRAWHGGCLEAAARKMRGAGSGAFSVTTRTSFCGHKTMLCFINRAAGREHGEAAGTRCRGSCDSGCRQWGGMTHNISCVWKMGARPRAQTRKEYLD